MSTIELTSDWTAWRATSPIDVLQPETRYECGDMPLAASEAGDVEGRVRQIRDPFVFEESGRDRSLLFDMRRAGDRRSHARISLKRAAVWAHDAGNRGWS